VPSIFGWLALVLVLVGIYFGLFTSYKPGWSIFCMTTAFILFAVDDRRKKPPEIPSLFRH
jgi:hypothetical protein